MVAPGILEITTGKHLDKLEEDEKVIAIYEKDKDKAKVLVDIGDYSDSLNYIH